MQTAKIAKNKESSNVNIPSSIKYKAGLRASFFLPKLSRLIRTA